MAWNTLEDALTIGYGIERTFRCPVHQDNNASASVNSISGLWICYSCNARGNVDVSTIEVPPDTVVREMTKVHELLEGEQRMTYPEGWLSVFDSTGPGEYWRSRFNEETCRHFRLGMGVDGTTATYPFRDYAGQVMGVVHRSLTDDGPKYRYPYGADVGRYMFGGHECSGDEVILTEGATDAMACWEVGYEAMALYGSRLSRHQRIRLYKYAPKRIFLGFDQDEAGESACRQVVAAFPELDVVRLSWEGAKDLASLDRDRRQLVLAQSGVSRVGSSTCGSHERPRQIRLSRGTSRLARQQRTPATL